MYSPQDGSGCPVAEKRRGASEEGDVAQTALVRLLYFMAAWDDDGGAWAGACWRPLAFEK
jgi:hypothetical protein